MIKQTKRVGCGYRNMINYQRRILSHIVVTRPQQISSINGTNTAQTRRAGKGQAGLAVQRLWGQCSTCSKSAYRSIIMSLPLIWEVSSAVPMSSWPGS